MRVQLLGELRGPASTPPWQGGGKPSEGELPSSIIRSVNIIFQGILLEKLLH